MASLKIFFIAILVNITTSASETEEHGSVLHRSKRQFPLLFPNSTLLQFNAGIGVPTGAKGINVNFAFQANFQLPWNRTQLPVDILLANSGYDGDSKKKRAIRDGDYKNDAKLFHFYKYMEEVLTGGSGNFKLNLIIIGGKYNCAGMPEPRLRRPVLVDKQPYSLRRFGHDGKACVRQALCQIGGEPLHSNDEEDLLYELASLVLNPMNDAGDNLSKKDEAYPYIKAYNHGQKSKNCTELYSKCKMSLVDVFSTLHVLS